MMSFLRNLSIRRKLLLALGMIALLTVVLGFVAVAINKGVQKDVLQIRQVSIEEAAAATAMADTLLELKFHDDHGPINEDQAAHDPKRIEEVTRHFEEAKERCLRLLRQAMDNAKSEGNAKEILQEEKKLLLLEAIETHFAQLNRTTQQYIDYPEAGQAKVWMENDEVFVLVRALEAAIKADWDSITMKAGS